MRGFHPVSSIISLHLDHRGIFVGQRQRPAMADRILDLLRPADKSPVDAQVAKVDGQGSGVGSGRETMTVREEEAEVSLAESVGFHLS